FARPSGKSIYNQRKDYGQILLKPQSDFQHHVEHLLTVRLERDIRSTDDCLAHLKALEAQGRVWGQDLILQVKDQELMLRDVESKEELEAYPLGSVQECSAVPDVCGYSSVLAISLQEQSPPGTSVLLFHCEQTPAPDFHASPQRGLPSSDYSESWVGFGACLSFPRSRGWEWGDGEQSWDPLLSPGLPDSQQMPRTNPPDQVMPNVDRDVVSPIPHPLHLRWGHPSPPCWHPPGPILLPQEVLNHVLSDLELFVVRLKTALGLVSTTNTKKKKKMNKQGGDDYMDFFQKVKYALNLMVGPVGLDATPWPVGIPGLSLPQVLDHCPSPSLAPAVEAPLLVPETVELLEKTLHQNNYSTWKSLGMAWNKSRAEYPNSELVPRYIPVFSDGWLPPPMEQVRHGGGGRMSSGGIILAKCKAPLPAQGLVRALYEFQGRNAQELSVRMGDTLQVLDQQKKWWLVQDSRGQKGYIPSNILEPLGGPPRCPLLLSPRSRTVTAWLKDKGFSRITVRCLGVLTGHQLLQMSPTELQAVCPEEWRRVLFKLSPVKMSLGVRDPQSPPWSPHPREQHLPD
uniref:EPS8 signaling adaptor L3 n=1 Tax=Aquila chrysaetos chrysaetos TaxID=223781 RepID=A0A663FF05_AQUCH